MTSSATISPCGLYRYRLSRDIEPAVLGALSQGGPLHGKTVAFFGVNPSTADATLNDATVRKWMGFCARWGAPRFIVGNVFAFRATDVQALATVDDPFGPDIGDRITDIINEADILVPCWGNASKVPPKLQFALAIGQRRAELCGPANHRLLRSQRLIPSPAGAPDYVPCDDDGRRPRGNARPARWHARTRVDGASPSRAATARSGWPCWISSTPRVVRADSVRAIRPPPTPSRSGPSSGPGTDRRGFWRCPFRHHRHQPPRRPGPGQR